MLQINIKIQNKIARREQERTFAICGNSDYTIKFDFDEEWNGFETKTARFVWNSEYVDVIFSGDECSMPIISNAFRVEVGVFAGDLHTTTPAVIPLRKSILCESGAVADPTPEVYSQLLLALDDKLDKQQSATQAGKILGIGNDGKIIAVEASSGGVYVLPIASSSVLGGVKIGDNLDITEDGVVSAETDESDFVELTNLEIETIISNIGGI